LKRKCWHIFIDEERAEVFAMNGEGEFTFASCFLLPLQLPTGITLEFAL